ncbi:MAG: ATP synthase F1 subunit delta [Flavobacteriaceae bacterium]|nr:ATP synthase F1 subunit delta [Flavobacteriaceae bacterium]
MAHYRVAKRYAKGMMDFLAQTGKEDVVMNEMKQLQELTSANREFKTFLASPVLDYKKKTQILRNILEPFSEETKTFLALITRQGRSEAIGDIASEFIKLYKKNHKIKNAVITSATPLSDDQIKAIVEKAKASLPADTKIEVENKINPALIGGFILRLDDQQFDASIKTKLNQIKKEFDSKHYIPKI